MSTILAAVLQWMTYSTNFKKWSGVVGGFALGLWVSARYWRQIRDVLAALGIERDAYTGALLAIAGACGISVSVALSNRKAKIEAGKTDPATPPAP